MQSRLYAKCMVGAFLAVSTPGLVLFFFSDFIPTNGYQVFIYWLSLAVSVALGAIGIIVYDLDNPSDHKLISKQPWIASPFRRFMVFATVGFIFSTFSLLFGYPWAYTAMFGRPIEEIATITGWHHSARSCSGPLINGRDDLLRSPHSLCSSTNKVAVGDKVVVVGVRTELGTNAHELRPVP